MNLESQRHLATLSLAEAAFPLRAIRRLLAKRLIRRVLDAVLRPDPYRGPALAQIREPDLAKVNYTRDVREGLTALWQKVGRELGSTPAAQLVERLDRTAAAGQAKIDSEAQQASRAIFANRAKAKAANLAEFAHHAAVDAGVRVVTAWIGRCRSDCKQYGRLRSAELQRVADRVAAHNKAIGEHKQGWAELLRTGSARKGSLSAALAGGALLIAAAGVLLWWLEIALTTEAVVGICAGAVLLALLLPFVIYRSVSAEQRRQECAGELLVAYRTASFLALEEMTKRLEAEYFDLLDREIEAVEERFRQRLSELDGKRGGIDDEINNAQALVFECERPMRVLVAGPHLDEWYERGAATAPVTEWQRVLTGEADISWADLEAAAAAVFGFLDSEASAASQLFRMHPTREGRLEFLGNLRDAALGSSLSEGFLSLDAGELGCEPPEVNLIVTIGGSHEPTLDDEIRTAWANTTVGLRVERVTDPTAISLMGLVYGFPVTAIKEWPEVERSFQSVKAREGLGIYPVLSPLRADGGADTVDQGAVPSGPKLPSTHRAEPAAPQSSPVSANAAENVSPQAPTAGNGSGAE